MCDIGEIRRILWHEWRDYLRRRDHKFFIFMGLCVVRVSAVLGGKREIVTRV